jgi:hypothetical protein
MPTNSRRSGKPKRVPVLYVRSLTELTDIQAFAIRSVEPVNRSPRKGALAERMLKVDLYGYSEARVAKAQKTLAVLAAQGFTVDR